MEFQPSPVLSKQENDGDFLSTILSQPRRGRQVLVRPHHGTSQATLTIVDWKIQLQQLFKSSKQKYAIVGVGHPLRGDDYVGSLILKLLKRSVKRIPLNVQLFDAEDNVESTISKLTQTKPNHIIFIDACEMNMKPGETLLIPMSTTEYPFFTTHGIPLKLLSERILPESECWILAIQPKHLEFSNNPSPEVRRVGLMISKHLSKLLTEENS